MNSVCRIRSFIPARSIRTHAVRNPLKNLKPTERPPVPKTKPENLKQLRSKRRNALKKNPSIPSFVKPAEQIRRELTAEFERLGQEVDENFIKGVIEQSKEDEKKLRESNGDLSILDEKDDFLSLFDRVMDQCALELSENVDLQQDAYQLDPNATLEDSVFKLAEDFETIVKASQSSLPLFVSILKILSINNKRNLIPIELASKAFELSTQIYDPEHRTNVIYYSGNLIYSHPRVRADPINESLYMEALLEHRQFLRCENLFTSRLNQTDVQGQRFWLENGMKMYLRSFKVSKAEELAAKVLQEHKYLHPSVIVQFIDVFSRLEQYGQVLKWTNTLNTTRKSFGKGAGVVKTVNPLNLGLVDDANIIMNYWNQRDPITHNDLRKVSVSLINAGYYELLFRVIETYASRYPTTLKLFKGVVGKSKYSVAQKLKELTTKLSEPFIRDSLSKTLEKNLEFQKRNAKQAMIHDTLLGNINIEGLRDGTSNNQEYLTEKDCNLLIKRMLSSNRPNYQLVENFIEEMINSYKLEKAGKSHGFIPPINAHVYATLIKYLGKVTNRNIEKLELVLKELESLEVPMNAYCANQIILEYTGRRRFERAFAFIDQVLNSDFPRTNKLYETMLQSHRDFVTFSHKYGLNKRPNHNQLRRIFVDFYNSDKGVSFTKQVVSIINCFIYTSDFISSVGMLQLFGSLKMKLNARQVDLLLKTLIKSLELCPHSDDLDTYVEKLKQFTTSNTKDLEWKDVATIIIDAFQLNPLLTEKSPAAYEKELGTFQHLLSLESLSIDEIRVDDFCI
ncbi:hypothetical protein LJB42_003554 [Komagataella kurtzmanii]|nr:hypothetical protein LJB42_003554 [Komagataella kurtzmanii]